MDELDKIQKLATMRDAGVVSAEEFEDGKRKLLASMVERDRPPNPVAGAPLPIAIAPEASAARRSVKSLAPPVPRTLEESVRVCMSKYADFSGRASRSEYWWFVFFVVLLDGLLTVFTIIVQEPLWGLVTVLHLAVALPGLAVGARRLHDVGRSGWWQAGFSIPAGLTSLAFNDLGDVARRRVLGVTVDSWFGVIALVGLVMGLVLVVWCAGRGQHFNNKYGPA